MPEIKTEFLFKITLEVPPLLDLGETPYGRRRIARIAGGSFEGPKLKGEVLPGGGDWLLLGRDRRAHGEWADLSRVPGAVGPKAPDRRGPRKRATKLSLDAIDWHNN